MSDMIRALRTQWQPSMLPHKDPRGAQQAAGMEDYMGAPIIEGVPPLPTNGTPVPPGTYRGRSIFDGDPPGPPVEWFRKKRGGTVLQNNEGVNET